MTPPGSVLISAYLQRGIAYEVKGEPARARDDFARVLSGKAADAVSKANQATARVRLALLSEPAAAASLRAPTARRRPAPHRAPATYETEARGAGTGRASRW